MDQSLLTLQLQLRLAQPGGGRALLGFEIGDIGLLRAQLVVLQQQVDLPEKVARPHPVAEPDFQRFELTRRARADVDLLDRLQHAGGEHRVFNVEPADLRRRILGLRRMPAPGEEDINNDGAGAERGD